MPSRIQFSPCLLLRSSENSIYENSKSLTNVTVSNRNVNNHRSLLRSFSWLSNIIEYCSIHTCLIIEWMKHFFSPALTYIGHVLIVDIAHSRELMNGVCWFCRITWHFRSALSIVILYSTISWEFSLSGKGGRKIVPNIRPDTVDHPLKFSSRWSTRSSMIRIHAWWRATESESTIFHTNTRHYISIWTALTYISVIHALQRCGQCYLLYRDILEMLSLSIRWF